MEITEINAAEELIFAFTPKPKPHIMVIEGGMNMACCNNNTTSCNTCNTCNTCNSGISFQNDLWIWIIVIALVVILFTVG